MDYRTMHDDYLMHYGVLGMKWGVRRYQNYDGTYTQKGLQHYRKAEWKYDRADQVYKQAKELYKNGRTSDGRSVVIDKQVLKDAKRERDAAKREMELHYKLLKQDKLADEGRDLYSRGIRSGKSVATKIAGIATASLATAGLMSQTGNMPRSVERAVENTLHMDFDEAMIFAASGASIVSGLLAIRDYDRTKKLGAYYSHRAHPKVKD